MNQDPITIEDIQRATQLGERAVRAWIRRLSIVPVGVLGRVHLYPSSVIPEIQAAQIRQSIARRATLDDSKIPMAQRHGGVISLAEAKRLAKGGA